MVQTFTGQHAALLSRETPCSWKKAIVLGEQLIHAVHISSQQVLSTNLCHPWEVVDSLQQKKRRIATSTHAQCAHTYVCRTHTYKYILVYMHYKSTVGVQYYNMQCQKFLKCLYNKCFHFHGCLQGRVPL